jgi:hypothetical protein
MMDKENTFGPMAAISFLIENGSRHSEWAEAGLLEMIVRVSVKDDDPQSRDSRWTETELIAMIDEASKW